MWKNRGQSLEQLTWLLGTGKYYWEEHSRSGNRMCLQGRYSRCLRRQRNPSSMNAWFCARGASKWHSRGRYTPCIGSKHAWSLQQPKSCFTGKWTLELNYQHVQVETRQKVCDLLTTAVKFYRLHVGRSCCLKMRDDPFFSLKNRPGLLPLPRPLIQSFKNALVRY